MNAHYPPSRSRGAIRTGCVIGGAIIGVVLLLLVMSISTYNRLVASQAGVEAGWQEIQNQYQRRFDLIPNLVETVKGAANFEQETLTKVIEARSRVAQVQLPDTIPEDPEKLRAYLEAQQGLGGALSRLFAVAEQYPQLRATANFAALQDQIEGTENRVTVARRDYIDVVRDYNTARRRFPSNLVAGMFGFEPAAPLPIDEAQVQQAPKVDFGTENR
jgi:LemA protein